MEYRDKQTAEKVKKTVKKKDYSVLTIFIIFLIIGGYVALDIWAVSQLTPVVSSESVWTNISNFDADTDLSQTSTSSTIQIENPTFIPIIFSQIVYDVNYRDTKIAEGKTDYFIIGPYSQKDIAVDLTVYNLSAIKSEASWIWNTTTGKQERIYIDVYVDIDITKFKIKTIE